MSPFPCSDTCFEGCLCDAGFVSDGDKCVSMETCGCMHEGQYLQVRLCLLLINPYSSRHFLTWKLLQDVH